MVHIPTKSQIETNIHAIMAEMEANEENHLKAANHYLAAFQLTQDRVYLELKDKQIEILREKEGFNVRY